MKFEEWANGKATWEMSAKDIWDAAYQAGREAMRQECVKVCEEFDIPDRVEGAHPDYITGKRMAAVQVSHKIKELK